MATVPLDEEPQPTTRAQRVIEAVVTPVTDRRQRRDLILAAAAALSATAPFPFGPLAVAGIVLAAVDSRR